MKLLDILARATRLMQDESYTTNPRNLYVDSINEAQKRITESTKIFYDLYTINSVNGTQLYLLPDDFMEFMQNARAVIYEDASAKESQMLERPYEYLSQFDNFRTKSESPSSYWVEGRYIGFYPIPDYDGTDNIKIEYYKYPAELVNDSDISLFPDQYLMPIAYLTASIVYEKNERYEEKGYYQMRADERLNEITNTTHFQNNTQKLTSFNYTG